MPARLGVLAATTVALGLAIGWRFIVWMPGPDATCTGIAADVETIAANLRRHVTLLAEGVGPRSGLDPERIETAAAYVETELQHAGWPTVRQPVGDGTTFANVVAMRGTRWPALLVVGAHYDTVSGSPGADDNASGVAGLLEIARLLSQQPELPIRLVAFVNEEAPLGRTALRGSGVAAAASSSGGETLRGMIALESIGFFSTAPGSQQHPPGLGLLLPGTGDFITLVGNPTSRAFLHELIGCFRATSTLRSEGFVAPERLVPHVRRSDHAAYWDYGYSAVMVTDTAEFRNPHYHEPSDLPDTLNFTRAAEVTHGIASAVRCLAVAMQRE